MKDNGSIIGPKVALPGATASAIWSLPEQQRAAAWPLGPTGSWLLNWENNRTIGYTGFDAATTGESDGSFSTTQAKVGSYSLVTTNSESIDLPYSLQAAGTVEGFYYKTGSTSGNDRVFSSGTGGSANSWVCFWDSSGRFTFRTISSSGSTEHITDVGSVGQNAWYHMAYSWENAGSGGTGEFFANGTRLGTWTITGNQSSTSIAIGCEIGQAGYYFAGFIDAYRITAAKLYTGSSITVPDPSTWGLPS
jgi:hypothetical protein